MDLNPGCTSSEFPVRFFFKCTCWGSTPDLLNQSPDLGAGPGAGLGTGMLALQELTQPHGGGRGVAMQLPRGIINDLGGPSVCLYASHWHSLNIPCVLGAVHMISHFVITLQSMLLVTLALDKETSERLNYPSKVSSQLITELRIQHRTVPHQSLCLISRGLFKAPRLCHSHILANLVQIHGPMDPVSTFISIVRFIICPKPIFDIFSFTQNLHFNYKAIGLVKIIHVHFNKFSKYRKVEGED